MKVGALATKNHDGESLFGRFAAEAFGSVRPRRGESAGTGGALRSQCAVGVEDFFAAAANRTDGASGATARFAQPGDRGGGGTTAPPVAGAAGSDAGGVAAR